ncbi:hypothetical protein [Singulisphaera sp. PoT]|uniref:hypothetical protein n=1 Tax=Singulisphaera sp. PoT TaxID=3411797 RepID=UPI003BF4FDCA
MASKADKGEAKSKRTPWLDDRSNPQIHAYTERLGTFIEALADGKIDDHELHDQQARVIALMKKVEPELSDELHHEVTALLCELTAYNIMHTLQELASARPKTQFRG